MILRQAYLEPDQIRKTVLFSEIAKFVWTFTIFANSSISDAWQGSEYTFGWHCVIGFGFGIEKATRIFLISQLIFSHSKCKFKIVFFCFVFCFLKTYVSSSKYVHVRLNVFENLKCDVSSKYPHQTPIP